MGRRDQQLPAPAVAPNPRIPPSLPQPLAAGTEPRPLPSGQCPSLAPSRHCAVATTWCYTLAAARVATSLPSGPLPTLRLPKPPGAGAFTPSPGLPVPKPPLLSHVVPPTGAVEPSSLSLLPHPPAAPFAWGLPSRLLPAPVRPTHVQPAPGLQPPCLLAAPLLLAAARLHWRHCCEDAAFPVPLCPAARPWGCCWGGAVQEADRG